MLAAEAAIDAIVGDEQVEHRGNQRLAILQLDALCWNVAHQDAWMVGAGEVVMFTVAEVGKGNSGKLVLDVVERQAQPGLGTGSVLLLQVPLALFAPTEPDRAIRCDNRAGRLVERHRFPIRIVALAQSTFEIRGAQQPIRYQLVALLHQPYQHRHVAILADVILEILGLPVDVELAQDDVTHGHGEGRVGALFHGDP